MQFKELEVQMSTQRQRVKTAHCKRNDLKDVLRKVSYKALDLLVEQLDRVESIKEDETCKESFSTVWGLPCRHKIKEYQKQGLPIPMSAIDKQWHLTMCPKDHAPPQGDRLARQLDGVLGETGLSTEEAMLVREATLEQVAKRRKIQPFRQENVKKRGRHRGARGPYPKEAPTGRILCPFEVGDNGRKVPKKRKKRQCFVCHATGHDRRTCPILRATRSSASAGSSSASAGSSSRE